VLPTLGDTFAQVILEAMASGLPVVASRVGAIPELVVEGETGFLVPPGDADALAQAVNLLLDESGLRERMGRAGWQRAREEFDIARNGRRLVDLALRAREEAR
ncbi:MAG TPA: glycosyltransferase, partial [Armatimonadota bacterium]|nr:glycosyltransferase [Armatimonadota bacterium]